MSSIKELQDQVNTLQTTVDAILEINELTTLASVDGTEWTPVQRLESSVWKSYKIDPATLFSNPAIAKTDDFDLTTGMENSVVVLTGNSKTLTIPASVGWAVGGQVYVIVYGTGFTIDYTAVTANIPQTLTDVNKSAYLITKTAADEYSIVQIGSGANVFTKTITITAAQLKSLGTTPIDLISSPGTGKTISLIRASAKLTWGSVAFDNNSIDLTIDGQTSIWTLTPFLNATATTHKIFRAVSNATTSAEMTGDAKLILEGTDSVAAVDSTVKIFITYEILLT